MSDLPPQRSRRSVGADPLRFDQLSGEAKAASGARDGADGFTRVRDSQKRADHQMPGDARKRGSRPNNAFAQDARRGVRGASPVSQGSARERAVSHAHAGTPARVNARSGSGGATRGRRSSDATRRSAEGRMSGASARTQGGSGGRAQRFASDARSGRKRASDERSEHRRASDARRRTSSTPLAAPGGLYGSREPQSVPERVLGLLAAGLLGVLRLVVQLFQLIFSLVARLARSSRIAAVALVVIAALAVFGVVDTALTSGRIYSGVSIGSVDVSGMTADEAADAVTQAYADTVENTEVIIFANDEIAQSVDVEQQIVQDQARAEQVSFEEAQKSKSLWLLTARSLAASLPVDDMVNAAMDVGRAGAGPLDRLGALVGGRNIEVSLNMGADELESLAADIDTSIGNPREDFDIAIDQGTATVVEGHDGSMVNRDELTAKLSAAFLGSGPASFVAYVEYAPLRIDADAAQRTCDAVNSLIAQGASFSFGGTALSVSREQLGGWVTTRVEEREGSYRLSPYIDATAATPVLVALANERISGADVEVDFDVLGSEVSVSPHGEVTVLQLGSALETLDARLFEAYRASGVAQAQQGDAIEIGTSTVSGAMSLDDALACGLVTEVSSFTTLYTNTESTANRNHNIHLVSDLLNNSVAKSGGGTWSFNGVAGNCNEEAGFLPAGAISGGEYIDEAGGGICQVATTVFNAVYEGGFPVVSRRNHTLYMASYPAGRDAAVSYPDLDFIWQNDTASDVLVRTSYTDSSVTVTLYGVDQGYSVSTQTGAWVEGEKHDTRETVDETLAPGTSFVKTVGTDGMEITVVRTVRDRAGSIVRTDSFYSVYAPIDEVVVKGPDPEDAEDDAKKEG